MYFLIVLVSLSLANAENLFKLECTNNSNDKLCTLSSTQNGLSELKVQHMICLETDCKESILFSDNQLFACQHTSKKSAECQKVLLRNVQPFQTALLDLYQALQSNEGLSAANSAENLSSDSDLRLVEKRTLPFETLNYGRKKRQLPFDGLNYGKRAGCDCSSQIKRSLPFETILYGKRALPFETLNYGKRSYLPTGYIMGKRSE